SCAAPSARSCVRGRGKSGSQRTMLGRMDMRKWCAAAAVGALCALPLLAQQKDETAKPATEATTAAAPAASEGVAPLTRSVWAIPAVPRTTPFPGPQAAATSTKDTRPPGKLLPRYEVNGGYSYVNFSPGSGFSNFNNHGGTGGFTFNASRVIGLT